MKITKAKLKQIIKEELELTNENKQVSGMINSLEQIGDEVSKAHKMAGDPAMIQSLEMIDGLITKLHDEMSDLLM